MNLGQLLGAYELRIAELEERLAMKTTRASGKPRGEVWGAIKAALAASADPLTVDEIASRCDLTRRSIANNLSVRVAKGWGVERVYVDRIARYRLLDQGRHEC